MGTKREAAPSDCYLKAEPDEPLFTLIARDPLAPGIVRAWALARENARGAEDPKVEEARELADRMDAWRMAKTGDERPCPGVGYHVAAMRQHGADESGRGGVWLTTCPACRSEVEADHDRRIVLPHPPRIPDLPPDPSPVLEPESDVTALAYELDGAQAEIARLRELLRIWDIDPGSGHEQRPVASFTREGVTVTYNTAYEHEIVEPVEADPLPMLNGLGEKGWHVVAALPATTDHQTRYVISRKRKPGAEPVADDGVLPDLIDGGRGLS